MTFSGLTESFAFLKDSIKFSDPMTQTNSEWVEKMASLSRLELTSGEVERLGEQAQRILQYVDQLGEVNTDGVEPLIHPNEVEISFRKDEASPSLSSEQKEEILASAPEVFHEGYRVPPVL